MALHIPDWSRNLNSDMEECRHLRMRILHFHSARLVGLGPLHQGVVDERLQGTHQTLPVVAQHGESDVAHPREHPLVPADAQAVDHVLLTWSGG